MDKQLFNELTKSVKQADSILNGRVQASRIFEIKALAVREIREKVGLSQNRFAALIHVSPATLRNWEQGRRDPSGAAAALLVAIRNDPKHVLAALNER